MAKKNISTDNTALAALKQLLGFNSLSGVVAGTFTTVLPTGTIPTDKVYAYAGVDNTTIGGIAWKNGDYAHYTGSGWTRIPFQSLANYLNANDLTLTQGKNLFNKNDVVSGYINDNGSISASASYVTSGRIPVSYGKNYHGESATKGIRRMTFYIDDTPTSLGFVDSPTGTLKDITPPSADVNFVRITAFTSEIDTFQFEEGAAKTVYVGYALPFIDKIKGYAVGNVYSKAEIEQKIATINNRIDLTDSSAPIITLPSKIYAVVGRELNLYYDSIYFCPDYGKNNPEFLFNITCAVGKQTLRSFRITPTSGNVGDHSFTFTLYKRDGSVLASKTVTLKVVASAISAVKNILSLGDSTSDGGRVTQTLQSNLAAIGNAPVFWGQHQPSPYKNEARTGLTLGSFASGHQAYKFTFTGVNPSLNVSNIRFAYYYHSSLANQIILSERFVVNPDGTGFAIGYYFAAFTPPTIFPATLTATDITLANGFPETITVTSVTSLPNYSVLKDNEGEGALNIAYYRNIIGLATPFHAVTIDFGLNDVTEYSTEVHIANAVNYAKLLIQAFLADSASSKIVLCLNKLNSSALFVKDRGYDLLRFNYMRLRLALLAEFDNAATYPNVIISPSGLAIDRYYGYPTSTVAVASRITATITTNSNDVHPSDEGYDQVADGMTGAVVLALQ